MELAALQNLHKILNLSRNNFPPATLFLFCVPHFVVVAALSSVALACFDCIGLMSSHCFLFFALAEGGGNGQVF